MERKACPASKFGLEDELKEKRLSVMQKLKQVDKVGWREENGRFFCLNPTPKCSRNGLSDIKYLQQHLMMAHGMSRDLQLEKKPQQPQQAQQAKKRKAGPGLRKRLAKQMKFKPKIKAMEPVKTRALSDKCSSSGSESGDSRDSSQ